MENKRISSCELELSEATESLIFELLKAGDPTGVLSLFEKGTEVFMKKQAERAYKFNKRLFYDKLTEEDKNNINNMNVSEEDYFSLLSASINDDESKKVDLYSTLYFNILKNNITLDKFKILKILKSLTYSSLELIQKIYIYTNYDIQTDTNNTKTINEFLNELENNDKFLFEVESLKQFGLLKKDIKFDSELVATNLCSEFAKVIFDNIDLAPSAIGLKSFVGNCKIISDLRHIKNINFLVAILNEINVKNTSILSYEANFVKLNSHIVICIIGKNIPSKKTLKLIERISKRLEIIKVTFDNSNEDFLNFIDGELSYIDNSSEKSRNNFLKKLTTIIKN